MSDQNIEWFHAHCFTHQYNNHDKKITWAARGPDGCKYGLNPGASVLIIGYRWTILV